MHCKLKLTLVPQDAWVYTHCWKSMKSFPSFMALRFSQHWISIVATTTLVSVTWQSQRQHSSPLMANGISTWSLWLSTGPIIFSATLQLYFQDCNSIFGQKSHFQQEWVGTPSTPRDCLQKTRGCWFESKCDFFRSQIYYLGHMLSAEGI